jgi:hypothetical protein
VPASRNGAWRFSDYCCVQSQQLWRIGLFTKPVKFRVRLAVFGCLPLILSTSRRFCLGFAQILHVFQPFQKMPSPGEAIATDSRDSRQVRCYPPKSGLLARAQCCGKPFVRLLTGIFQLHGGLKAPSAHSIRGRSTGSSAYRYASEFRESTSRSAISVLLHKNR